MTEEVPMEQLRPGDVVVVKPNERIPADGFVIKGQGSDGRPSAFNNRGQLAFQATFTDGCSGIFVSNRVAVPEPSTLLLAAFAAAGLLNSRRSSC